MNFPEHICLYLRHNPHRGDYTPIEQWVENYLTGAEANGEPRDEAILPEDRAAILATGEVWELSWCPRTPVGSCVAIAATLERVLELAGGDAAEPELVALRTDVDARQALLVKARTERDQLEARVAGLEGALDSYGDYSRHGDAIRRVLGKRT